MSQIFTSLHEWFRSGWKPVLLRSVPLSRKAARWHLQALDVTARTVQIQQKIISKFWFKESTSSQKNDEKWAKVQVQAAILPEVQWPESIKRRWSLRPTPNFVRRGPVEYKPTWPKHKKPPVSVIWDCTVLSQTTLNSILVNYNNNGLTDWLNQAQQWWKLRESYVVCMCFAMAPKLMSR